MTQSFPPERRSVGRGRRAGVHRTTAWQALQASGDLRFCLFDLPKRKSYARIFSHPFAPFVLPSHSFSISYRTSVGKTVVKLRTLDLNSLPEPRAFIQYLERPKPGGEGYHRFLHEQKIKTTALFPERQGGLVQTRSLVEPPTLIRSFFANAFNGIPLDNHLAVNRQDQVVSGINTHMIVLGPTGTLFVKTR